MVFTAPNSFGGATLYLQAHSLDPSASGIPVRNSDGKTVVVPVANPSSTALCSRVTNNSGTTTATQGLYFSTSSYGYVLTTEFTY